MATEPPLLLVWACVAMTAMTHSGPRPSRLMTISSCPADTAAEAWGLSDVQVEEAMNVAEIFSTAKEMATVRRVYAEPYEKNGVTIIPAALVSGGAGGGSGHDEKGGEGEGGGLGVKGRPAGAYVIKGDEVTWRPAVDPNRVIAVVGLVVAAYLLSRPRMVRARAKHD